jgi:hypothetical protein
MIPGLWSARTHDSGRIPMRIPARAELGPAERLSRSIEQPGRAMRTARASATTSADRNQASGDRPQIGRAYNQSEQEVSAREPAWLADPLAVLCFSAFSPRQVQAHSGVVRIFRLLPPLQRLLR